jgi:hypothetical protein
MLYSYSMPCVPTQRRPPPQTRAQTAVEIQDEGSAAIAGKAVLQALRNTFAPTIHCICAAFIEAA